MSQYVIHLTSGADPGSQIWGYGKIIIIKYYYSNIYSLANRCILYKKKLHSFDIKLKLQLNLSSLHLFSKWSMTASSKNL